MSRMKYQISLQSVLWAFGIVCAVALLGAFATLTQSAVAANDSRGSAGMTNTTSDPDQAQALGGCPMFPADSIFNTPIDTLLVDANSDAYINSIGADTGLHPDFGAGLWDGHPIGIPYNVVPKRQLRLPVKFMYAGESDKGPYPIPSNPKIEGGSDRHLLTVQKKKCELYELFAAKKTRQGKWRAGSGAIWDLNSNALRPSTWTSADAAGLPILPLLARYDQVAAGEITEF